MYLVQTIPVKSWLHDLPVFLCLTHSFTPFFSSFLFFFSSYSIWWSFVILPCARSLTMHLLSIIPPFNQSLFKFFFSIIVDCHIIIYFQHWGWKSFFILTGGWKGNKKALSRVFCNRDSSLGSFNNHESLRKKERNTLIWSGSFFIYETMI